MSLPQNAKKVFNGIIFDVYHYEQKMFDGTTETFEMLKRPDTVQVIAAQGDKILIGFEQQPQKKEPFFTLLGGRVDKGEAPEAAAKRELLEESGLSSNDWELYKSFRPYNKIDWEIHIYIARGCKKVAEQKLDAGEKIEIKKVSFNEFVKIATEEKFLGREMTCELLKMRLDDTLQKFKNKLTD